MDLIERLLHVSPDGGNGTVEFVIYLVVVTVLALTVARAVRTRNARRVRRRR